MARDRRIFFKVSPDRYAFFQDAWMEFFGESRKPTHEEICDWVLNVAVLEAESIVSDGEEEE